MDIYLLIPQKGDACITEYPFKSVVLEDAEFPVLSSFCIVQYCHWAGKTLDVHLAPEYVYITIKHLRRAE